MVLLFGGGKGGSSVPGKGLQHFSRLDFLNLFLLNYGVLLLTDLYPPVSCV